MVDRALVLINSTTSRGAEDEKVQRLIAESPRQMQQIVARRGNRIFLINPGDAAFFYMDAGIVRMRVGTETYWVNYQLGELEDALQAHGFFRAHRSSLVNLARVQELRVDPRTIVLVMDDPSHSEVEVSERQARILRARMPGL